MKLVTVIGLSFSTLVAVTACGNLADPVTYNGPTSTADAGIDAANLSVPDHRTQGVTCSPTAVGPEPQISDAGLPEGTRFDCQKNEDCTAHAGGRCVFTGIQSADPPTSASDLGTRCLYDECATDSDCPTSSVCQCGGVGAAINSCSPVGNCRTDADCANAFCSPSKDGCADFNGYFCHTPSDECATDDDCAGVSGLDSKCIVDPSSGVWGCEQIGCASAGSASP